MFATGALLDMATTHGCSEYAPITYHRLPFHGADLERRYAEHLIRTSGWTSVDEANFRKKGVRTLIRAHVYSMFKTPREEFPSFIKTQVNTAYEKISPED
jgi:hypothetical protein